MYKHSYRFPANLMNDGLYQVTIILLTNTDQIEINISNAISFTVRDPSPSGAFGGQIIGSVRPRLKVFEKVLSQPADDQ